jgi:hypothetical protein
MATSIFKAFNPRDWEFEKGSIMFYCWHECMYFGRRLEVENDGEDNPIQWFQDQERLMWIASNLDDDEFKPILRAIYLAERRHLAMHGEWMCGDFSLPPVSAHGH